MATSAAELKLPDSFRKFLADNGLSPEIYRTIHTVPRHIRVNPRALEDRSLEAILKRLQRELHCDLLPTAVPLIFAIPAHVKIASSLGYKEGIIYGIDLSSAVAAYALSPQADDSVLDLCCAPGAKLCLLGDLIAAPRDSEGVSMLQKRAGAKLVHGQSPKKSSSEQAGQEDHVDVESKAAEQANRKSEQLVNVETDLQRGSVVGVDVHLQRLQTCRHMVLKYRVPHVRLFCADGQSFNTQQAAKALSSAPFPPLGRCPLLVMRDVLQKNDTVSADMRHHRAKPTRRERKRRRLAQVNAQKRSILASDPATRETAATATVTCKAEDPPFGLCDHRVDCVEAGALPILFDKVLVDAECTHDGSLKHIAKYQADGWSAFERKVLDPGRIATLQTLQRSLLLNGYRNLAPGGVLVYSTCSFCRAQNEAVVNWLLQRECTARLEPLQAACTFLRAVGSEADPRASEACLWFEESLHLPGAGRFGPLCSGTSGLFIARVRKADLA